jgi:excisionase family DNA binding protein
METDSDWRDKKGIAAYLKCSIRHITNLMLRRKIPYSKLGRIVRFKISEVEAALKATQVKCVGSY